MSDTVWLSDIKYQLGERRLPYHQAESFAQVLRANAIPDNPALFGWGSFHKTDLTLTDMAMNALRETLQSAALPPQAVDVVIFCSAGFSDQDIYQGLNYQEILHRLEMTNAFPIGMTLGGCTMLLAALRLAQSLVETSYQNVLIVSVDKVKNEQFRFQNYALFSDGAVSCLVSTTERPGFAMLGHAYSAKFHPDISSPDDLALYKSNHQKLLAASGLRTENFKKVFTNNLFFPVVAIKEGQIGITTDQLYCENIAGMGHCFSADTLINLENFCRKYPVQSGELFLLNAVSIAGQRGQIALRFGDGT